MFQSVPLNLVTAPWISGGLCLSNLTLIFFWCWIYSKERNSNSNFAVFSCHTVWVYVCRYNTCRLIWVSKSNMSDKTLDLLKLIYSPLIIMSLKGSKMTRTEFVSQSYLSLPFFLGLQFQERFEEKIKKKIKRISIKRFAELEGKWQWCGKGF